MNKNNTNNNEMKEKEDYTVIGEICLDKQGQCVMNIPLLAKINPTEENMALLQKSVDLIQEFLVRSLLSEEEMIELRDKCIDELKEKKEKVNESVKKFEETKEEDKDE